MKSANSIRRYFIFSGLLLIGLTGLQAQVTHYLFFQTENNKPFYLRIMGSTLSSNASGYLLIPKITNGKYEIHIGFAQTVTEQQFEITVEDRDLGFSVKQELDNSWSLFNLVDFSQQKGRTVTIPPVVEAKPIEAPVVTEKEPKEEKAAVKKENTLTEPLTPPVNTKEVGKKKIALPEITKIYDKASADGVDMVFVVSGTPKSDTVIIYVPVIKPPGIAGLGLKEKGLQHTKTEAVAIGSVVLYPFSHPFKTP